MPLVGGLLVSHLEASGYAVDLRLTFYQWMVFMFLAVLVARHLREPDSVRTRTLVFSHFPSHAAQLWGSFSLWAGWSPKKESEEE